MRLNVENLFFVLNIENNDYNSLMVCFSFNVNYTFVKIMWEYKNINKI